MVVQVLIESLGILSSVGGSCLCSVDGCSLSSVVIVGGLVGHVGGGSLGSIFKNGRSFF